MWRLMAMTGMYLLSGHVGAQSSDKPLLNFDAAISLNHAIHIQDSAPRTTERGGQLSLKFSQDQKQYSMRGEGRLRWNDAYNHRAYSAEARDAYRLSADWRELYVATDIAQWNVSFGLQQVVWGKADNLRVVDIVNPVSLRDFIVPDLNEYRKPVMMLRATGSVANWNMEVLYLPRFTPTSFAQPGSEFDMPLLDPQMLQNVTLLPEQRPANQFKNGEVGLQASRSFEGVDLSLFLLHTWDDNPVLRQSLLTDASGIQTPAIQVQYRRQLMAGVALANAIGNGMVLRSELAFVPNFTYMVNNRNADGLVKSATLTGLIGLDYSWRDWLFSLQANDRYISGWNQDYFVKKRAQLYTFSATGTSMAGKLESRFSLAGFSDSSDGYWAQLKTTWKPDDHWAYTIGADTFSGKNNGVFGRFRDKDRLWLEMKYRF